MTVCAFERQESREEHETKHLIRHVAQRIERDLKVPQEFFYNEEEIEEPKKPTRLNDDLKKIAELIKKDTAKFLVYSTYAKMYISKISTTYGDYLDSTVYLNKFILSSYPQIIIYQQGAPYEPKFESVKSGYLGALKMTILEEIIHVI